MKATTAIKALVLTASILHSPFSIFNSAAQAAVIEQVIVRQQWPWSTDVKVEYKVTGITTPVNIGVRAFNGDVELSSSTLASAIKGDLFGIAEDGVGSFVIDPVKAFGTSKVALANFKVKLSLSDAPEGINEVIYKVFDLSTGACTDIKRSDFYNGKVEDGEFVTDYTSLNSRFLAPNSEMVGDVLIWTGVTNNVKYKTTHLVMRKIPAANKVWRMGALPTETGYRSATETNHLVKLTQNYYMGVFEITQKQYTLLVGNNPSSETSAEDADIRAANKVQYGRETANNNNTAWEAVKRIRTKTGNSSFCLPTSAQWEFACRAGSTAGLYSGRTISSGGLWSGNDGDVTILGWFSGNASSAIHPVGRKLPNSFGLYDTLGNVWEWTQDNYTANDAYVATFGTGWQLGDVVIDPLDTSADSKLVGRGGAYDSYGAYVRCAVRFSLDNWTSGANYGMRMALMDDAE